jgi:putative protease
LKKAGVDVLKIEGRARRPFYVAVATREYFNALHGKITNVDNLKLAFNREYTAGYFDGNGKIISNTSSLSK